ncbi:hypothetical protein GCM10022631_16730 [Deinococcus rubellus]|uniref:Uncharacterized protein n=1 Tax=Deinococcus rubellus TaxID=1889240 RepID=A0ABY5YKG7_9DEIO|nr:hypothetical protein [Deinococcus rubellus]UWX64587.1 hypothetical protein N0D28_02680 [Deinococcus rubellus]
MSRTPSPRAARPTVQTYRAGCARTWALTSAEPDLAYTDLTFPECPDCPHRVTPDGGPDFCTLRPQGTAHPFAALASLKLT